MLDALRRGDRVVTGGGIIGTVAKVVNNEEVAVDIAEGVRVRVVRSTIASVLAKPEPAAAKDDKDDGRRRTATAAPRPTRSKGARACRQLTRARPRSAKGAHALFPDLEGRPDPARCARWA